MAGGDRIRLFCALQLPGEDVEALAAWQQEHLPGGRIVLPEHLHVTLAFLGSRPADELPAISAELRAASAAASEIRLEAKRYRETRSVGMVVMEDLTGAGAALAADLGKRLEALGAYRREARPWLPHVTVLRFRERAGLAPPAPNMCSYVVRSALYRSTLGPGGARYDALETAPLGGWRT